MIYSSLILLIHCSGSHLFCGIHNWRIQQILTPRCIHYYSADTAKTHFTWTEKSRVTINQFQMRLYAIRQNSNRIPFQHFPFVNNGCINSIGCFTTSGHYWISKKAFSIKRRTSTEIMRIIWNYFLCK